MKQFHPQAGEMGTQGSFKDQCLLQGVIGRKNTNGVKPLKLSLATYDPEVLTSSWRT